VPAPCRARAGPRRRLSARAAVAVAALALAAGCGGTAQKHGDLPVPVPQAAVPTVAPVPLRSPEEARALLEALPQRPRRPPVGYVRDAFGSAWADVDGNGCNQRDDVLLRDAVAGTARYARQGSCDHDVLAGTWVDPYTGRRLTFTDLKERAQAEAIQIDHLVPLAEAWASGARSWDDARRREFANDLGELVAADGPTNAAKGDDDPAAWRPRKAFQCTYAVRWIDIKSHWGLAVDAPERRALRELLRFC
jgi:Protein of unknown function (DUF1524)